MSNSEYEAKDNKDTASNNNNDVLSALMNPDVVIILSELIQEGEEKYVESISEKLNLGVEDIENRISILVENSIITKSYDDNGFSKLELDKEKLDDIVGNDENFAGIEDGLAKLDQYLN